MECTSRAKAGESVPELVELRLGLAAAEVGQRPRRVPEHRELGLGVELLEEGVQSVLRQHHVAALRRVARDVAERPHRLLADVVAGRAEEEVTKMGTAPLSMTTRVFSGVPDAMFVSASRLKLKLRKSSRFRNCTK